MGRLIQLNELHQARRRRSEKVSMEQCVELLEWNLKKSVDDYFAAPREERSMRATPAAGSRSSPPPCDFGNL